MLESVCKHHKEWVTIVKRLGGGDYSEDIVQEMYIKLFKYSSADQCINNGVVNKYYIFLTLKSILFQYFHDEKRIKKQYISTFDVIDEAPSEATEAYNSMLQLVTDESEKWRWFDRDVFNLFRDNKTSFRKMSKATKISFVSLFHTVKKCKNKIKVALEDEVKCYNDGDFDKLDAIIKTKIKQ